MTAVRGSESPSPKPKDTESSDDSGRLGFKRIVEPGVSTAAAGSDALTLCRWWEQVLPVDKAFDRDWAMYMCDTSVPWTKKSGKHVLACPLNTFTGLLSPTSYQEELQDEIILAITRRIRQAGTLSAQPLIHFDSAHVHVSGLDRDALIHLWKMPPVVRGKAMSFVTKGLWLDQPHVKTFSSGPAMPRGAFLKTFADQYAAQSAQIKSNIGLYAAFARFYQVNNVGGEPIFSGNVIVFGSGLSVVDFVKPFFGNQEDEAEDGTKSAITCVEKEVPTPLGATKAQEMPKPLFVFSGPASIPSSSPTRSRTDRHRSR